MTASTATHDANGNPTEENAASSRTSFLYGSANRLTTIKFADATVSSITYDGDGLRRSAFEAGGSLTVMIWDGDDYLMEKS